MRYHIPRRRLWTPHWDGCFHNRLKCDVAIREPNFIGATDVTQKRIPHFDIRLVGCGGDDGARVVRNLMADHDAIRICDLDVGGWLCWPIDVKSTLGLEDHNDSCFVFKFGIHIPPLI